MKTFVDETAWIQFLNPTMPYHKQFVEEFERAIDNKHGLVTHNIAVGAALNEIKKTLGIERAGKFNEVIEEAHTGAYLNILWIGRRTQKEAVRMFRKHSDLSLDIYDFAAYIFMKRRRIRTIITTKNGYSKLGFKVIPELGE